jgi:HEAT repeat protein
VTLPPKRTSIRTHSGEPADGQSSGRHEERKPSQSGEPERPSKKAIAAASSSQRAADPERPSQRSAAPARSSRRDGTPTSRPAGSARHLAARPRGEEEESLLVEPPEDPRGDGSSRRIVAGQPQSSSRFRATGSSGSSARGSAQQVEPMKRSDKTSARVRPAEASSAGTSRTSARRSQRASIRNQTPSGPLLTLKHKILITAVLTLIVGAIVGYRPVRRSMLGREMVQGSKTAAETLFKEEGAQAVGLFVKYLKPASTPEEQAQRTAGTPMAAVHGLGLAMRSKDHRKLGIEKAHELFTEGPDDVRRVVAAELKGCADYTLENRDAGLMQLITPVLLACVDAQDPELRLAGLYGLGRYESPGGGCLRLLRVAREEKDPFRTMALSGIEMSATPEAIEHLLNAMSQQEDKPLAEAALKGFVKIRDKASTAKLLEQLTNLSAEVRLETTKALALRKGDREAAKGIVRALTDASAPVRVEAVRAFPTMRVDAAENAKLEPLITDDSEDVRVATGASLMSLSDETSWKLLMGAFGKDLKGKALESFIMAVAKRGHTKAQDGRRNLQITRVLVDQFTKHAESSKAIANALAELSAVSRQPHRFPQRQKWAGTQWKAWQENAEKREVMIQDAMGKLREAHKKQDMEYRDEFPRLLKLVDEGLELLEKAKALSSEDQEDEIYCDETAAWYTKLRYHFQKDQAINAR